MLPKRRSLKKIALQYCMCILANETLNIFAILFLFAKALADLIEPNLSLSWFGDCSFQLPDAEMTVCVTPLSSAFWVWEL